MKLRTRAVRWVAALIVAYVAATIVVALAAGLGWGTFLGAAGTAVGTLGLAFWSYAATRASQALEGTALETLAATKRQAAAAEHARIDALAPIIDLDVSTRNEWFRLVSEPGNVKNSMRLVAGSGGAEPEIPWEITTCGSTGLEIVFTIKNVGNTTAFVRFTPGAFVRDWGLIRIPPGSSTQRAGDALWSAPQTRPDESQPLKVEAEIRGPMTESTTDKLTWTGKITLLSSWPGPGNVLRISKEVLLTESFGVERSYPD